MTNLPVGDAVAQVLRRPPGAGGWLWSYRLQRYRPETRALAVMGRPWPRGQLRGPAGEMGGRLRKAGPDRDPRETASGGNGSALPDFHLPPVPYPMGRKHLVSDKRSCIVRNVLRYCSKTLNSKQKLLR